MKTYFFAFLTIFHFSRGMAQQYETQQFKLIKTIGDAEIRYYPPVMKSKTNRNNGFSALFGYISGKNATGKKIAMTTPVYMQENQGQQQMEFVLPRELDQSSTPAALSDKVEVYESKPGYFMAYTFGGYALDWVAKRVIKKVEELAEIHKIKVEGEPIILVYNSPYKVINRKNEILFKIDYSSELVDQPN